MIPIIIINWNGLTDTKECIDALFKQIYQDFQIYLIDNNSLPDQVETLKHLYSQNPKIKLILNSQNLGFAKAHNAVFPEIIEKYKHVVLLNNDTKPQKEWLENLVSAAAKADMVSSKMVSYSNPQIMDNAGHFMLNTGEILPIGAREPALNYPKNFSNMGPGAGAALYSTKMLKQIGTFDPYFSTGYEDAELGVRAILAGYKSIYEPKAVVLHKGGNSIKKVKTPEYNANIQKNIYYTFLKLSPLFLIIINMPLILLKIVVVIFVSVILGRKNLAMTQILALRYIWNDLDLIGEKRKLVKRKISTLDFMFKQNFFLITYLRYFWLYFVSGKKSILE
jgi:GT2 family glycosyltransferase